MSQTMSTTMSDTLSLTVRELAADLDHRQATRPANAARRTLGRRLYYLAWALVAIAAAAYLLAVTVRPAVLLDWFPALGRTLSQPQGNDATATATAKEAQSLRTALDGTRKELQEVRQVVAERDAAIKTMRLRVSRLLNEVEVLRKVATNPGNSADAGKAKADVTAVAMPGVILAEVPPKTPAKPAAQAAAPTAQQQQDATPQAQNAQAAANAAGTDATQRQAQSFELVNGEAAGASQTEVAIPLPARRPADVAQRLAAAAKSIGPINQVVRPTIPISPEKPAATAIETGSVSAPATAAAAKAKPAAGPIAFGPAVVTRSQSAVGVRLTAAPSVDALRLSWNLMSERHGTELGSLEPRYVSGGAPSAPFALIAGPLPSEREAQDLCTTLITKGIPCSVDAFTGNAL